MSSPVPPPRFELADTFPEMGELEARAATDLPGALALVAEHRSRGAEDHGAAVAALVEVRDLDGALDRHLEHRPGDREARTVRAARAVREAWRVRGPERATAVDRERFARFFDLLGRAEADLLRVCAQDPSDATAWRLRLSTARGLSLGPSECRRRWDHLTAAGTPDLRAQREYLQLLTPKWGGDWDRVAELVRTATASAPPGSAAWSLVAYARLVRWHDEGRAGGTAALHDEEAAAALEDAADRFLAAPCPSRYAAVTAHTDFAVTLGLAGRRGRAVAHFAALGAGLDETTWSLAADHHDELDTIRASALAEGRRR